MVDFIEYVQSYSPGSASFGMEGGRATLQLDVLAADLDDAIVQLLGACEPSRLGGLNRTMPKAHPRFPWMFAQTISNIQGFGVTTQTAAEADLEATTLEQFAEYPRYRLTVEFLPRMYPVLEDNKITSSSVSYTDDSGNPASKTCYTEWERFTDYDILPQPQEITAQYGQMKFIRDDHPTEPSGNTFHGFPRILINNSQIRFRWIQVPFSYLDSSSSYLTRYAGYINQQDWYGWPAGSLLYRGCTARRYVPPVPARLVENGATTFSIAKLCDIEMIFDFTERTIGSAATAAASNYIAAGHNLMPWIQDRKFYYVISNSSNAPTYLSVPFQLLFQDPDT